MKKEKKMGFYLIKKLGIQFEPKLAGTVDHAFLTMLIDTIFIVIGIVIYSVVT